MKSFRLLLWIVLLVLASQGTHAAGVTYTYSASVYLETRPDAVNPDIGNSIPNGDPRRFYSDGTMISGRFTYDPSTLTDTFPSPGGGNFFGTLNLNLMGEVEGKSFADPTGGLFQSNEMINGTDDLFLLLASAQSDDFSGFQLMNDGTTWALSEVGLIWQEGAEEFFTDDSVALDMVPQNPGATRIRLTFADVTNADNTQNVFAQPLNLQVVPIPAAVWLFGSALGLLGFTRKRQQ